MVSVVVGGDVMIRVTLTLTLTLTLIVGVDVMIRVTAHRQGASSAYIAGVSASVSVSK